MRAISLAVLTVLLAAGPAAAQDAFRTMPNVAPGMAYREARTNILVEGWRPVPGRGAVGGRCRSGAAICDAFPEAQLCTRDGFTVCSMQFRKPGSRDLDVVTAGDDPGRLRVRSAGIALR